MDLLETNTSRYQECLNFTVKTAHIVYSTKIALSSFAIIANFTAIGFILFTKRYKDFIYRLMAYLMFTDILQAIANMAIMAPVTVPSDGRPAVIKHGQTGECIASGFFSMATLWMGNVIFFWISLYLAYRGWCLYRHVGSTRDDRMESVKLKDQRPLDCSTFKEIFGVLVLFIGPFAISSIPFFVDHDSYGLSGLWCWMKVLNHSCGDLGIVILILLLLIFYGPQMIIVLFALAFMAVAFLCYCRGEVRKHDKDKDKKERYIKEIVIILPQPILYWTACIFLFTNPMYSVIHDAEVPYEPLWIVHAVADSTRVMLPALAFLLHPYVWKDKVTCLSKSKPQTPSVGDTTAQNSLIPPGYGSKGYGSCNVSDTDAVFANYEN